MGKVKFKIKTGDKVVVISGGEKGKVGFVENVDSENSTVCITGVRERPNRKSKTEGAKVKLMPVHISNVSHLDPKLERRTRVKISVSPDGKKMVISKKTGEAIRAVGGRYETQ